MVAQLVVLGVFLLVLILGGVFVLLHTAITNVRAIAEQALVTSKAVSARDLAEAKEYSLDAAMSREVTKMDSGPSVATLSHPEDTYTTPEGVELKVLRPFL